MTGVIYLHLTEGLCSNHLLLESILWREQERRAMRLCKFSQRRKAGEPPEPLQVCIRLLSLRSTIQAHTLRHSPTLTPVFVVMLWFSACRTSKVTHSIACYVSCICFSEEGVQQRAVYFDVFFKERPATCSLQAFRDNTSTHSRLALACLCAKLFYLLLVEIQNDSNLFACTKARCFLNDE